MRSTVIDTHAVHNILALYTVIMPSVISRFVPRGSSVLAMTTLGSYILGLLRDRIFAHTFGASVALDSYNAAFLIPDFLFNLLVASGIAAAVVPLFTQLKQRNRQQADAYINATIAAATAGMVCTGIAVMIAAPWVSHLVAPGLDATGQALVVRLMRVLAMSPILFGASNALGAMLVAQKRFLWYGVSPMVYNLGIIGGTLILAPTFGIVGVAYGTVIGAGLHLLARLGDAIASGWHWQAIRPLPMPELKRTLRLMIPKMFGHPIELVTFWVFTAIASLLTPGSVAVLNFARNFQSVPVSLLGIAMATAVFPALAEAALASLEQLRRLLWRTALAMGVASIAAALAVFVIRRPLVALLLGGGAFDASAVAATAMTLGVFCLSIPTESLSHLLARAFYATQNTIIPVVFSVVSLIVAGGSAYVLSRQLGIIGLPLGFFLGSSVKTVGLVVVFHRYTSRRSLSH